MWLSCLQLTEEQAGSLVGLRDTDENKHQQPKSLGVDTGPGTKRQFQNLRTSSPGGLVPSAREGEKVEVRSVQYCEQVVCQL